MYNPVIHQFDRYLQWLVSKFQVLVVCNDYLLTRKCTTNRSKYVEINKGSILHTIMDTDCIYNVWCTLFVDQNWCIQNVYMQNVSHISTNFCIHFVYKMYTKCLYIFKIKCTPHFNKLLYTFCIQNLADIDLWILYTKCIQKLVKCGIHLVQFLYTKCIHSFRVGLDIKL